MGTNMRPLYLDHAVIITSGEEARRRVHDAVDGCAGKEVHGRTTDVMFCRTHSCTPRRVSDNAPVPVSMIL
jgi:hypothetical protein